MMVMMMMMSVWLSTNYIRDALLRAFNVLFYIAEQFERTRHYSFPHGSLSRGVSEYFARWRDVSQHRTRKRTAPWEGVEKGGAEFPSLHSEGRLCAVTERFLCWLYLRRCRFLCGFSVIST